MLELVTLPPAFGMRNVSPFCLKAEMLLTSLGLPFKVQRTYHLHGLGRHSAEEQEGFARRDLEALNSAVEGKEFLFGDMPGVFDFAVAAMMAGIYDNKPGTWLTQLAQPFDALRDYTERVQTHVGVYGRNTSAQGS